MIDIHTNYTPIDYLQITTSSLSNKILQAKPLPAAVMNITISVQHTTKTDIFLCFCITEALTMVYSLCFLA